MSRPILVSACLLGLCTRYDGTSKENTRVRDFLRAANLSPIPVCPEQLGGLPTPRPPARFVAGDGTTLLDGKGTLASAGGEVLNDFFLRGAEETLKIARLTGSREALFKERSPSCGVHRIRGGEEEACGQGVTAALLHRHGLKLYSEEELDSLAFST